MIWIIVAVIGVWVCGWSVLAMASQRVYRIVYNNSETGREEILMFSCRSRKEATEQVAGIVPDGSTLISVEEVL
jgi:hypothetical protein